MRISVRFYGRLKDSFGKGEAYELFSDSKPHKLSEILEELSKRKGKLFTKAVYQPDRSFDPHLSIILNGRVVTSDNIEVDEDCTVLFIPYVAGG